MKIDYSQLQTFIECPRRYYNRYKLSLKKIIEDEREVDMNFGSAMHKALEAYYKGSATAEVLRVFNENFSPLAGDQVRTPRHAEALLSAYIKYYSGLTNELGDTYLTTLSSVEGKPLVEVKDTFNIGNIEYIVKIDRIVKSNAGNWVQDHKCTTKSLYTFSNKFTPNMQVSGYVDYVTKKYGQCSGFIPNVLWFGFRTRAYKGEPAGFHYQFQRDIINRTKEQIADFEQNVIYWCAKLEQVEKDNYWGKNENQCVRCSYRELCISCDDETVKEALYKEYDAYAYLNE